MSLKKLWKATRLTLAIVGLSVVHSFSVGEWTMAENAPEEDSRTWLSNNQAAEQVSKREDSKVTNRQTTADQISHRSVTQLSISQLVATATVL